MILGSLCLSCALTVVILAPRSINAVATPCRNAWKPPGESQAKRVAGEVSSPAVCSQKTDALGDSRIEALGYSSDSALKPEKPRGDKLDRAASVRMLYSPRSLACPKYSRRPNVGHGSACAESPGLQFGGRVLLLFAFPSNTRQSRSFRAVRQRTK